MSNFIKKSLDSAAPDPGFEQRLIRRLEQAGSAGGARWYDFMLFNPGFLAAAACLAVVALAGAGLLIRSLKPASPAQASLAGLPPAVRKIVQSQSAGTVASVEQNDDDGEISYTIGTRAPNGMESNWTVAGDGTLLSVNRSLADLSAAVRDAIAAQAGQNSVDGIEEDFDNGEPEYVATVSSADGRQRDFTFGTDGTLLEVETSLAELPGSLQSAIKAQVRDGTLGGIDKTFDDGETSYVADITSADGRERDFTFDEDGTLSSIEQTMPDLPLPVQAAIQTEVGSGKLEGIDKTFDGGEIAYDATITTPDGWQRGISLSENGKLISREVAMSDTARAVQQTVARTIGQAKVVEIDQLFTESGNTVPYEVEARKDGKPFYFLVSPTGDYLGMED